MLLVPLDKHVERRTVYAGSAGGILRWPCAGCGIWVLGRRLVPCAFSRIRELCCLVVHVCCCGRRCARAASVLLVLQPSGGAAATAGAVAGAASLVAGIVAFSFQWPLPLLL